MTHAPPGTSAGPDTGNWRTFMRTSGDALAEALMRGAVPAGAGSDGQCLARSFVLAKHGRAGEARRLIEGLKARRGPGTDAEIVLVDAHVRVYEDRPSAPRDAADLRHVLDRLPADDRIGQALALNHLCIHALHTGHFDRAQEHAESAIRLYRQGGAEFGSLHMLAHLGQIRLLRGDLEGAAEQYAEMERQLGGLSEEAGGLIAVCRALRSEVAYETNDLAGSAALLSGAMGSVEDDDAWLDVRAAAYRVRTRLAYAQSGLPGALTELAHCEQIAMRRHMPRLHRLMQVERVRVLTLSGETGAALAVMQDVGLGPERYDHDDLHGWALRQGSTSVAIARWLVRSRRAQDALAFLAPAEDIAIRGGQLLPLAKLRVIRAAAHWRLNQKPDATGALLSAMRLLGRQPFRRFILDEGAEAMRIVRAALDGDHVSVAAGAEQRRQLSELSHAWITETAGSAAGATARAAGGDLRRKYLELVSLGMSNKEIARTMGVTVNTVKYHLKAVFRELRVESRAAAIAEAHRLGLLSDAAGPG